MKKDKLTKDLPLSNIFPDKDNTYDLLEFNMREDLENFVTKYVKIFHKLQKEALKINDCETYDQYGLSEKTLSIQAMARIAYFFDTYLPRQIDCTNTSYDHWFLDDISDCYSDSDQENGKSIWKFLVELGQHLDDARTKIDFLANDIGIAEDAAEKRRDSQKEED